MLRFLQIIAVTFFTFSILAQAATISDSVQLGKEYKLDVWYSLKDGFVGESDSKNWDLAFVTKGMGGGIHVNGAKGIQMWLVPDKTIDDFDSFSVKDTLGMSENWNSYLNSEDTWSIGALNLGLDGFETDGDFGWGSYDMTTHYIVGEKLFVIKLNNTTYKKFIVEIFDTQEYSFKCANLDGSEESYGKVAKKSFTGKNLGYFSFDTFETIDREPSSKDWQLTFGKYQVNYPIGNGEFMPYAVTGVRQNSGVRVAAVNGVNPATAEAKEWNADNYLTKITTIGSDWKSFNNTTFEYDLKEDLVYFISTDSIQSTKPQIFRLYFTGFEGQATGKIKFEKETLPVSVIENEGLRVADFSIYPSIINSGEIVNLAVNNFSSLNNAKVEILSVDGRLLNSMEFGLNNSMNALQTNNLNLTTGMYFVKVTIGNRSGIEKLIVK
ncbi:MAG TPA: T9SS type A sorting domain-containing protein [Candidatus Kapabacteria bacterium]|nr:T9SS type A sorting domain-containing protein [Candidatus Kapabacteria bacterium]